jgi:hypothetical protein
LSASERKYYRDGAGGSRSDEMAAKTGVPTLGPVAMALVKWLIARAKAPSLTLHQAVGNTSTDDGANARAHPNPPPTAVLPRPYFCDAGAAAVVVGAEVARPLLWHAGEVASALTAAAAQTARLQVSSPFNHPSSLIQPAAVASSHQGQLLSEISADGFPALLVTATNTEPCSARAWMQASDGARPTLPTLGMKLAATHAPAGCDPIP